MSEELINQKLNELDSMTDKETGKPTLPVKVAIQEAEDLEKWCKKDQELLIRAGLDWKLVDDLDLRIDALKVSQSKWEADYKSYQDCQEEWKKVSPEAFNLRDEMVHHFYHALYNNPGEYAKVKRIADGASNADMIQDLINLSELGMRHTAELEAIRFDLSLLDKARAMSFELGDLLGRVNSALTESAPSLNSRNKAFTHLKEATDEIRRVGQYVFWRNETRLNGYASKYLRRMNEPRKKKEDQQAV